ncbi:MAG: hypothetical protein E6R13_03145 [Spirochaetes bacterium]|nr:MAG: hypothetical protein E6R13_03145 [Spirochaetota bacterium]
MLNIEEASKKLALNLCTKDGFIACGISQEKEDSEKKIFLYVENLEAQYLKDLLNSKSYEGHPINIVKTEPIIIS